MRSRHRSALPIENGPKRFAETGGEASTPPVITSFLVRVPTLPFLGWLQLPGCSPEIPKYGRRWACSTSVFTPASGALAPRAPLRRRENAISLGGFSSEQLIRQSSSRMLRSASERELGGPLRRGSVPCTRAYAETGAAIR